MGHDGGPTVVAAGRIILKRDMGKLSFITLRDESGDLQVGLDKRKLSDRDWQVRDSLDLGDLIVVTGKLGVTNKGETTVWGDSVSMAAKALLPPPAKWEGLSDVEIRYRQRYVDLWANPEVMKTMQMRIRIVDEIRQFMRDRGFLEVETPMMQPIAGGAAAWPFVTHHKALDIPLYLRIAPELYLKRLLVGGFTKIFEINRNFRNEGISPRHNPEFTMIEAYEAFGSWETMADLVEEMITTVAQKVLGTLEIGKINLKRPWRRVRMTQLVEEKTGWKFDKRSIVDAMPELLNRPELAGVTEKLKHHSPGEQLVEVYEKLVEHTLLDPCFVTHVPSAIIPLARENREDPFFADVYELAINGMEISPGYSELNDPDIQAKHFAHQVGDKEEQQKVDEDFLTALKYGMPPAGGMGLGIDRLVTMLTGAASLRDVILFPLMRPVSET
jgi:lysyl-tRNA synthetase class 2